MNLHTHLRARGVRAICDGSGREVEQTISFDGRAGAPH
jgi:hypothetical protein